MKSFLRLILILVGFYLCTFHSPLMGQTKKEEKGKIKKVEEEVEKDSDDDDDDQGGDDPSEEIAAQNWFNLIFTDVAWNLTFRLAWDMLVSFPGEDTLLYKGDYGSVYYTDYPYADPTEGLFSDAPGKQFFINLAGHYFYDESDLDGVGFRGRASPYPFVSAEVHFTELREHLRSGGEDVLQLYSAFINYNRLRLPRWSLWWGLGLKGMRGSIKHTGFAFNAGTEIFLARPLSLHFSYSGGFLNSRYVPEFFGTLNVHINRFALFGGYQSWTAGSANIDGILTGMKIYF